MSSSLSSQLASGQPLELLGFALTERCDGNVHDRRDLGNGSRGRPSKPKRREGNQTTRTTRRWGRVGAGTRLRWEKATRLGLVRHMMTTPTFWAIASRKVASNSVGFDTKYPFPPKASTTWHERNMQKKKSRAKERTRTKRKGRNRSMQSMKMNEIHPTPERQLQTQQCPRKAAGGKGREDMLARPLVQLCCLPAEARRSKGTFCLCVHECGGCG